MNNQRKIAAYNEETPTAMARVSKFGSIYFDGQIPNEHIISLIPPVLSNACCPLGVIVEPANKKKSDDDCNQSIVSVIKRANTANWPTDLLEPAGNGEP